MIRELPLKRFKKIEDFNLLIDILFFNKETKR